MGVLGQRKWCALENERLEPTNQPFRKEHDLNQTSMIMFHVNLQGSIEIAHVGRIKFLMQI